MEESGIPGFGDESLGYGGNNIFLVAHLRGESGTAIAGMSLSGIPGFEIAKIQPPPARHSRSELLNMSFRTLQRTMRIEF